MLIRDASVEDAGVIAEIRVASWRVAYAGLMPDELLSGLSVEEGTGTWSRALSLYREDNAILLVEQDGDSCGFVVLGPNREQEPGWGEIFAMYLRPEVWRQGLGSSLMSAARDRFVRIGYHSAILWVLATNTRARRFYEAMGWEDTGRSKIDHAFGSPLNEVAYQIRLVEH